MDLAGVFGRWIEWLGISRSSPGLLITLLVLLLAGLTGIPAGALDDPVYDNFIAVMQRAADAPPALSEEMLTIEPISVPDRSSGDLKYTQWLPYIEGRIMGRTRPGDILLITVARQDREIASYELTLKGNAPDGGDFFESFELDPSNVPGVSDTGELSVIFRYRDASGTREIARRAIRVFRAAEYLGDGLYARKFAIRQDDLLGSSVMSLEVQHPHAEARVNIVFWACRDEKNLDDFAIRILVNGAPLTTRDGFFSVQRVVTQVEQCETLRENDNTVENRYNFRRIRLLSRLFWGPARQDADEINLAEHPGSWVVSLLYRHQVVREFYFTVTADGMIAPHAEQDPGVAGALRLSPMTFFVETRFGETNTFDDRFSPEAIATSGFYGRAWTSEAVRQGMRDRLPPGRIGTRPFPVSGE